MQRAIAAVRGRLWPGFDRDFAAVGFVAVGGSEGRRCSVLAWGMALLVQSAAAMAAVTLADDRGQAVALAMPAQRIVTLAPHLAEIVSAAGAGGKLAGVARFSDFPEAASRLPQVGDSSRVDLERIVALKPDLILAWQSGNQAADIARLERLGFPVFVTEAARLDDIPRLLRAAGALAGTLPEAERAAQKFMNKINALKNKYDARPPLRVFYEVWHRPLITVNGRHMISDVIRLCGGRNVFADAAGLTPVVSEEAVLAARPDVVVGGGSAARFAAQWRASAAPALRGLPVFHIDPDIMQRSTPRIVEGARLLCERLESVRRSRGARP